MHYVGCMYVCMYEVQSTSIGSGVLSVTGGDIGLGYLWSQCPQVDGSGGNGRGQHGVWMDTPEVCYVL